MFRYFGAVLKENQPLVYNTKPNERLYVNSLTLAEGPETSVTIEVDGQKNLLHILKARTTENSNMIVDSGNERVVLGVTGPGIVHMCGYVHTTDQPEETLAESDSSSGLSARGITDESDSSSETEEDDGSRYRLWLQQLQKFQEEAKKREEARENGTQKKARTKKKK